jgi:hypothetical protein
MAAQIPSWKRSASRTIHPNRSMGRNGKRKKPKDVSKDEHSLKRMFTSYLHVYINPKKNKDSKIYAKIRFVTASPDSLKVPLPELGQELLEDIEESCGALLYKTPYPCNCCKWDNMGWLFGSVKTMDQNTFVPALREKLGIPDYVAVGVQWHVLKKWVADEPPPPMHQKGEKLGWKRQFPQKQLVINIFLHWKGGTPIFPLDPTPD